MGGSATGSQQPGSNDLLGGPSSSGAGNQYSLDGLDGMMGSNAGGGFLDSFQNNNLLNQGNQPPIQLSDTSELDSERFQQLWMQLPNQAPLQKSLRLDVQFNIQQIESYFKEKKMQCMANGQMGTELKFFFHCQMADKSGFFMSEMLFNLQNKTLTCTTKSTRPDMDQSFQ